MQLKSRTQFAMKNWPSPKEAGHQSILLETHYILCLSQMKKQRRRIQRFDFVNCINSIWQATLIVIDIIFRSSYYNTNIEMKREICVQSGSNTQLMCIAYKFISLLVKAFISSFSATWGLAISTSNLNRKSPCKLPLRSILLKPIITNISYYCSPVLIINFVSHHTASNQQRHILTLKQTYQELHHFG